MICDTCQGRGIVRGIVHIKGRGTRRVEMPCRDCGGSGHRHCCDGDQPSDYDKGPP